MMLFMRHIAKNLKTLRTLLKKHIKQLSHHQINDMNRFSIFCLFVITFFSSCNFFQSNLKKYQPFTSELNELLSDKYLSKLEIGKRYDLTKVISSIDPLYITLFNNGIINEKSFIHYSNKDCISLVTRVKENNLLNSFTDILITNNRRLGQFICGINDIYLLNQDEYVVRINTYSESLDVQLTVTMVSN